MRVWNGTSELRRLSSDASRSNSLTRSRADAPQGVTGRAVQVTTRLGGAATWRVSDDGAGAVTDGQGSAAGARLVIPGG